MLFLHSEITMVEAKIWFWFIFDVKSPNQIKIDTKNTTHDYTYHKVREYKNITIRINLDTIPWCKSYCRVCTHCLKTVP